MLELIVEQLRDREGFPYNPRRHNEAPSSCSNYLGQPEAEATKPKQVDCELKPGVS